MIAKQLSQIPVSTLPAAKIERVDILELSLNVSWFEALKFMVQEHISAVPVKENDKYIGYIDRFTFVHWAAQYAKKIIEQQSELRTEAVSPENIRDEITQIFTTHPLTQFERSCFNPMVCVSQDAMVSEVAEYIKKPGTYRVYLTDNEGVISGVITQQSFFSWLIKQPFVKDNPTFKAATTVDLLKSRHAGSGKTKNAYRTFSLNEPTYNVISALKRNSSDKGAADGCVMLGEEDFFVTVLRRRDLDILAKMDDLTMICAPLTRTISTVRSTEVYCSVSNITIHSTSLVEATANRLAVSRFEHAFVIPANSATWRDVQEVVTDGMIIRYILSI